MPDIQLRFAKDMLVLSSPVQAALENQGFDTAKDLGYACLVEPELVRGALMMNKVAGAQVMVAPTAYLTPARLAHQHLDGRAQEVAEAAVAVARKTEPQHLLLEIAPCGLPLDPSSKASLNENRSQYASAARVLAPFDADALFLSGFAGVDDLKCALMGVRQVWEGPLFVSVNVRADGMLEGGRHSFEEALATMADLGADVVGLQTGAPLADASALASKAASWGRPSLVQLSVGPRDDRQGAPTAENPYYCPDTLVEAAAALRGCGTQFLRACGCATPAYTGALVAASEGFDVVVSE